MTDVIILAGGKGTRLQGVVSDRPKSMAGVAGRPFLEWLLLALRAQGLRRVILATGYLGEAVEEYFGDGRRLEIDLVYSREATPLGTGGAARLALGQAATDQVLVINGDSYCRFDAGRLGASQRRAGVRATLWLVAMDDCRRYGAVELGEDGQIVAFREKSERLDSGLISAGIYLFSREVLAVLPAGRAVSLESEVFPALVGHGLYAVAGAGPFLDIGTPDSYSQADAFLAETMAR